MRAASVFLLVAAAVAICAPTAAAGRYAWQAECGERQLDANFAPVTVSSAQSTVTSLATAAPDSKSQTT